MHVVPADPAQISSSAMPRLIDLARVEADLGAVERIWQPAPGLGVILVVPTHEGWGVVDPGWVSERAGDADLWEGALTRLRYEAGHSDRVPADIADPWGTLTAIASPSPHTASWMLVPDALLASGVEAFIAAPDQHRLVLMACTGEPADLRGPVMRAPHHLLELWRNAAAPVSPHLYHWSATHGLRQLTRYANGEPELCLPDDVREWLGTKDEDSEPSS